MSASLVMVVSTGSMLSRDSMAEAVSKDSLAQRKGSLDLAISNERRIARLVAVTVNSRRKAFTSPAARIGLPRGIPRVS